MLSCWQLPAILAGQDFAAFNPATDGAMPISATTTPNALSSARHAPNIVTSQLPAVTLLVTGFCHSKHKSWSIES
jgi:hypothetical protein